MCMNNVTKNFLSILFAHTLEEQPGFLELRLLSGKKPVIQHFFPSLDAIDEKVFDALQTRNEKGWNVYVSALPRDTEKGDAAAVTRVTAFWVDIDAKHLAGGKDEALALLLGFPIVPTMMVDSGHGYHAYWKLTEEIQVSDEEASKRVRSILHGLAVHLKGDLAVKDLSRVMRLPGFMNMKEPQSPVPCTLLEEYLHPELTYTLEDFVDIAISPSDAGIEQVSISDVSVPERFQAMLEVDKHLRDTWDGEGEMPRDNSRSGWDMSLANQLANHDFAPSEIAAVLRIYAHGKGSEATKPYLEHTIGKAIAAKKQRTNVEEEKLQKARKDLAAIDPESPRTDIPVLLNGIMHDLHGVDTLRTEPFFTEEVKQYFKLTKETAQRLLARARDIHRKMDATEVAQRKVQNLIRDRAVNWGEVMGSISKITLIPHELVEIAMAVYISSELKCNPPLWLLIIGVPSSSKTMMIAMLSDAENAYMLDTMTENSFMSGFVPKDGGETQDLLPKLDGKCFMVKELSAIFSMNEETVKKLLGDFTSIFDGEYAKFTATRGDLRCESLFSMIGCVTPMIMNRHQTYTRQLGPRFLFLTVPDLTEEERKAGFKISRVSKEDRDADVAIARRLASSFCTQKIESIRQKMPTFSYAAEEVLAWLEEASQLLAQGRGLVEVKDQSFTGDDGKQVVYFDVQDKQIEQPWRVLNQLKSLACALAYLRGRTVVQQEELDTLRNILTSTMPVERSSILKELIKCAGQSIKDLSQKTGRSSTSIRMTLKEMEALDLVDRYNCPNPGETKSPNRYFVDERFADILKAARPSPEKVAQSRHVKVEEDVI